MTEPASSPSEGNTPTSVLTWIRNRVPRMDTPSDAEKTWSMVAHFGGALGMLVTLGVGGWIVPLIVLLAKGDRASGIRAHAVNALNFQILWSALGVLVWLIQWRPSVLLPLLVVTAVGVVFGAIGGLRANEGRLYTYPMSPSLIK